MTAARGGPQPMGQADAVALLAPGTLAGLCVEDEHGALRPVPVWISEASSETITLRSLDGASLGATGAPACLVVDEFASYVGIRGAIVRGILERVDGAERLTVTRASGFSFENTTTSL